MANGRPKIAPLVRAQSAAQWRRWLATNHAKAKEGWLVLHTKASGKPFVAYGDSVDEALCYGWIDSVVKPIGEGSRAQRFSPRRPGSPVSELNRARVRKLVKDGRMTERGMAALPDVDEWLDPPPLKVARDIEMRIRKDPDAWRHYAALPEPYKRIRIGWIEGARKRPEVFEARLAYFIKMTAKGKRFGMLRG